jgi:hypothetical protein
MSISRYIVMAVVRCSWPLRRRRCGGRGRAQEGGDDGQPVLAVDPPAPGGRVDQADTERVAA